MIETIAIIFSLISTWQAYKKNIWSWVTGMIGIIGYFYIFMNEKNWANVLLQIVFFIQYIYGWFRWKEDDRVITLSSSKTILKQSGLIVLIYIACYYINVIFKGNLSMLDASTTALSVVAMVLLADKKIESWLYFILADILYITLFASSNHIYSSLLYLAFLIIAIIGFFEWKKEL